MSVGEPGCCQAVSCHQPIGNALFNVNIIKGINIEFRVDIFNSRSSRLNRTWSGPIKRTYRKRGAKGTTNTKTNANANTNTRTNTTTKLADIKSCKYTYKYKYSYKIHIQNLSPDVGVKYRVNQFGYVEILSPLVAEPPAAIFLKYLHPTQTKVISSNMEWKCGNWWLRNELYGNRFTISHSSTKYYPHIRMSDTKMYHNL